METIIKEYLQNAEKLDDKEINFVAKKLKEIYLHQRYKSIADVVIDVLTRAGKENICHYDKALIKICYLASNSKTSNSTDYITMEKSIFNAIRHSKRFILKHEMDRPNGQYGKFSNYYIK